MVRYYSHGFLATEITPGSLYACETLDGTSANTRYSMSAVNLVVVVESVHLLVEKYEEGKLMTLHIPSLVAVGAALGAYTSFVQFAMMNRLCQVRKCCCSCTASHSDGHPVK